MTREKNLFFSLYSNFNAVELNLLLIHVIYKVISHTNSRPVIEADSHICNADSETQVE